MFTAALYEVLVLGPLVAAADQESAIGVRPLNRLEGSKAAGAGGLVIFEDPLTLSQRSEIAAVAGRLRLPAIYGYREFAEAGGPYALRHQPWRAMAARRGDCRPHPQRREAGRHPGRAADQVRACGESQDRRGLELHRAANDHDPRQRRHRMRAAL